MTLVDNRPQLTKLTDRLYAVRGIGDVPPTLLQDLLDASIAWLEDEYSTRFNAAPYRPPKRDGNGTNRLMLMHRPVTSIQLVEIQLPVLALSRTYQADEVKLYRDQGYLEVFTYKLAAEYASLHLDQQIYGNIFPAGLPQILTIEGTWGFPQISDDATFTSLDGSEGDVDGILRVAGDQRTDVEQRWLRKLQEAVICDAAASFLAQVAGQGVGLIQSVSFDGFSQGMNPQAYGSQVQTLISRRDEMLASRKRGYYTSTAGV